VNEELRIRQLLREARPPLSATARERVAMAARAAAPTGAADGRPLPSTRLGLVALAMLGLIGFSFTPPGRAIADGVAGLVGIGDAPTVDHSANGPIRPTSDQVVIGTGTTPDGVRFEIVAFEGRPSEGHQQQMKAGSWTCVALDWPDRGPSAGSSTCMNGPQRDPLPTPSATVPEPFSSYGPGVALSIQGLTGPAVDEVELTYETSTGKRVQAPLTLARLDDDLAQQAGTRQQFGFFVAFMPADVVGRDGFGADVMKTIELTVYANGQVVKELDYGAVVAELLGDRGEDLLEPLEARR
jgi:hypothetical protein